ncbi:uncharacterized protein LOC133744616 [Rosa rugosa]|uniref:uncharacterized protein LOC133744616 n=1 Tax=Rosa rugosa TaxID=74645 RepID=UPI002B408608|nr:uncharacterized protein LOC133744616 [Rosa rugosa]
MWEHRWVFSARVIDETYKDWVWHGEPSRATVNANEGGSEATVDMVEDGDAVDNIGLGDQEEKGASEDEEFFENGEDEQYSVESNDFMRLVEDGDKALYPGCTKHTKLNALIQIFNLKAKHGMSDVCYSDMLIMIGIFLPEGNEIPGSHYEAKKTLATLGMDYKKIHACPNDCILYRGQHADASSCPTCGESRWKLGKDNIEKQGVPGKVLWYFPPIPRFKRMFQSTKTSHNLTWHANERRKDEFMRHPADAPTWNSLSSRYSCWPVILVTYNLRPWLCMKRKFMMLTLLISGPKQPGNDIDVYMQPLIDDLKALWDGIDGVYDAFRGEYFKLRAVLFWTINDFPAYGNLSGSVTKGYNGCPICCENTKPHRLSHGQKMSHIGHRRWLPRHHPYRRLTKEFNNLPEFETAPEPLSGEEVLERVEGMTWSFGKKNPLPIYKGLEDQTRPCWKKKSIFFELEYWKFLPVRHNLDVMHIEKNVCDSIIGTLFNIPGKTKDGVAARLDMVEMGIRTGLGPTPGQKKDKLPLASWNLLLEEKRAMCMSFFNMKGPYGISSNIRNLVSLDDLRLVGLKSHDCHMVMQQLLPIAIRSSLEKPVRFAIIRFCLFFKAICSKVIDVRKLKKMQEDLVLTVCELEKYFPPSFFDIMIHLTVHLVREVELCGPVFFRWMYPFERYMKTLKGYVRNRNHPEGCIAESYVVEEAVEFCSDRILSGENTVGIPSVGIFDESCTKPLSGATVVSIYGRELELAHLCVLQNTEEARPYFIKHMEILELTYPKFKDNQNWLTNKQNQIFAKWIKEKVLEELSNPNNDISETLRWIADGPNPDVPTFCSYMVNGVHFNTKERDDVRKVQNSGVFLHARALQVASAKDKNPKLDDMQFYGVITTIWEMDYQRFRIPVFKCDWVENAKGIKVDEFGFTLVNLNRIGHVSDNPFVLGKDVKQVWYVADPLDDDWSVVITCPDRDYANDNDEAEELENLEVEQQPFIPTMPAIESYDNIVDDDENHYMREGNEGIWVDK